MEKIKRMKERMLSVALTLMMVVSLWAGMTPVEVQAEETALTGEGTGYNVKFVYGENVPRNVSMMAFDSGYAVKGIISEPDTSIEVPDGGIVSVFSDDNFSVTVEDSGAQPGDVLQNAMGQYYCDITNIKTDTTITVNKVFRNCW